MKHEVIETPCTHSILKLMFECKTFDQNNEEKSVRQFETYIKTKVKNSETVDNNSKLVKAVPI